MSNTHGQPDEVRGQVGTCVSRPTTDGIRLVNHHPQACFLGDSTSRAAAQRTLIHDLQHGRVCVHQQPVDATDAIDPADFARRYMATNTPLLLRGAAAQWPACRWWRTADGSVDLDGLLSTCGAAATVPVSDAASGRCTSMSLDAYVQWWRAGTNKGPLWYAKDWHVVRECAAARDAYTVPPCFSDDWLNAHCDRCDHNDYRFVYLGPQVQTCSYSNVHKHHE